MTPEAEQSVRRGLITAFGFIFALVGLYFLIALLLLLDILLSGGRTVMFLPEPVLNVLNVFYKDLFLFLHNHGFLP